MMSSRRPTREEATLANPAADFAIVPAAVEWIDPTALTRPPVSSLVGKPSNGMDGSTEAIAGGRMDAQPRVASLLNAIRRVESGGNDMAIGDGGAARGPLQIHRALWTETCHRMRWDWKWPQDAHSWNRSCAVAVAYWRHYGMTTPEQMARSWNGGPTGPSKTATLAYWRKVKAQIVR
jgi:hypothetical protein